ncbi:MAG: DinB family protein [Phycisphaeraceae bacterium]
MTAKQLLLKQTAEAFGDNDEMSLKASLWKITATEASWRPDEKVRTAEQIVRHVAWCKSWYCEQGFGTPMLAIDERASNLEQAMTLLEESQRVLVQCLESCPEEKLAQPIPTKFHGELAAYFFWIMLMHDLYHAGQIRTRRTMFRHSGGPGDAG